MSKIIGKINNEVRERTAKRCKERVSPADL